MATRTHITNRPDATPALIRSRASTVLSPVEAILAKRRADEAARTTPTRFHNLPDEALADALGRADAVLKAAEAETTALKDEFKRRGLRAVAGNEFAVTCTEQIAGRLDAKAVKTFLGDAYSKFENAVISNVIRIKAADRRAIA